MIGNVWFRGVASCQRIRVRTVACWTGRGLRYAVDAALYNNASSLVPRTCLPASACLPALLPTVMLDSLLQVVPGGIS